MIPVIPGFKDALTVIVTLNRGCKEINHTAVSAEVNALISKNIIEADMIYIEGSGVHHHQDSTALAALPGGRTVQEASRTFSATTSSITVEIGVVTQVFLWLETHNFI